MRIIAILIQLQYSSYVASYIIYHYSFILTETINLSIQAAIFHPAREIVNYVDHSQQLERVDSIVKCHIVNIDHVVKNS